MGRTDLLDDTEVGEGASDLGGAVSKRKDGMNSSAACELCGAAGQTSPVVMCRLWKSV